MNAHTQVSRIADLLERVKAATGPSRTLDALISEALQQDVIADAGYDDDGKLNRITFAMPRYTASIDASLALMKRKLPDANCYGVERDPFGWNAYVSRNHVNEGHWLKEAVAPTAPLAILAALLTALQDSVNARD